MSTWTIDWFSSAVMFPLGAGEEAFLWRGPGLYDPLVVYQPKAWLCERLEEGRADLVSGGPLGEAVAGAEAAREPDRI